MILTACIAAAWLAIGCLVAARCIPWRDVSFHAPFARQREGPTVVGGVGAPESPGADRAFFFVAAVLWPVAWRWHKLGAFRPRKGQGDALVQGEVERIPPPELDTK